MSSVIQEYFDGAGIEVGTPQYAKFIKACLTWADFAEYFFKDPRDWTSPLRLTNSQREAAWVMQFGTPYWTYDYPIVMEMYDKGRLQKANRVTMVWGRGTGKTTICAATASAAFISHRPFIYVGMFSQAGRRTKETLDRCYEFINHSIFKDIYGDTANKEECNAQHGSKLFAYNTAESIHGLHVHLAIADEAPRIDDNILNVAIVPTTFGLKGKLVMLGTPKKLSGYFIFYHQKGIEEQSRYCPNCGFVWPSQLVECPSCKRVHDGKLFIPGSIDAVKKVVYMPVRMDPFDNPMRSKDEVWALYNDMAVYNPALAKQQVFGELVDDNIGIFQRQWFVSATNRNLSNARNKVDGIKYYMGIDFGKTRNNTVFVIGHKLRKKVVVDYTRIVPLKKDYFEIEEIFFDEVGYWVPVAIGMDANGVGEGITDIVRRKLIEMRLPTKILSNKKNHYGIWTDYQTKKDLIEMTQVNYANGLVEIPPWELPTDDRTMKEFVSQHLTFEGEIPDNRTRIIFGTQAYNDDCVFADAFFQWVVGRKTFMMVNGVWAVDNSVQASPNLW